MIPKSAITAPSIDTKVALQRLNGNTQLLLKLASFFLEDAPQYLDELHDGLRQKSAKQITESAHRLRGLASPFEANPVMELTAEIERLSGVGASVRLQQLATQLDTEFERLIQSLRKLNP